MEKRKLTIRDIEKQFNGKIALNKVSFDVYDGEFLSILGPSGCGKTTILRILIGLLKPDGGSVIKDGEDITGAHPSVRGMGIVFQNYALFENMTVLQNVEYALLHNKEIKEKYGYEIKMGENLKKYESSSKNRSNNRWCYTFNRWNDIRSSQNDEKRR